MKKKYLEESRKILHILDLKNKTIGERTKHSFLARYSNFLNIFLHAILWFLIRIDLCELSVT